MIRHGSDNRVRRKAVWGTQIVLSAMLLTGAVFLSSCGEAVRQGEGSSYLIINSLQGASGAEPGTFGTFVHSDVLTDNTFFNDIGQATLQLGLKDPGSPSSPNDPSPNNWITIDRYHVEYVRSDGRNVQGVDVPYAFDGAVTATVAGTTTLSFTLVRNQAKTEAPLAALVTNPAVVVTTIAKVTFYGHDQTGRGASVTGNIEVTFANFADPGQ